MASTTKPLIKKMWTPDQRLARQRAMFLADRARLELEFLEADCEIASEPIDWGNALPLGFNMPGTQRHSRPMIGDY